MVRRQVPARDPSRVLARLDRLTVATRSHWNWVLLLFGATFFELADIPTFSLTAPTIRKQWGLSITEIGVVTSVVFLGMFVGSLVGGVLADRLGRKWTLVGSLVVCSLFSLLCGVTNDVPTLGVCRFVTGAGIAATAVVVLAFASEMYPPAVRGRFFALIFTIAGVGSPVVSWYAKAVIPLGEQAWRWVFAFGGVGLLVAAANAFLLPESLRWLVATGRAERAERLIAELEREARRKSSDLPEPAELPAATGQRRVRDLFSRPYRGRTTLIVVSAALVLASYYGFTAWVPTLLVERGFTNSESLTYASIFSLGAIVGAVAAIPIIDRWERKAQIGVIYGIIAILMLVYGAITARSVVIVVGFLAYTLFITGWVVINTYMAEIYPTTLRGVGSGLANGVGRLAAFSGSNLIAIIFLKFGYFSVFVIIAIGVTVTAVAVSRFGLRTTNRSPDLGERSALNDPVEPPRSPTYEPPTSQRLGEIQ